jgi:phosphoribosylaminoimidazole-succinocarboxamide synthase
MINELQKKGIPFDEQNYQFIEFTDHFSLIKNKTVKVKDLGKKFAAISSFFYEYLHEYHIPTAFVNTHSAESLTFLKFDQIPFKVRILNNADKRTSKIFKIKENDPLTFPVFEYHFGDGKDSLVSESHLISFDLCSAEELKMINRLCSKINAVLKSFFERRNKSIAEVSCSFGKFENKIILVDEFTPLSIKIISTNGDKKAVDPYKITTAAQMKKYSEYLFNNISN